MTDTHAAGLHARTKQLVRAAFDRAAASYDGAAVVQKEVCQLLLAGLDADGLASAPAILDAGCGTGYGARLLRTKFADAQLTLVDFAPAMLQMTPSAADTCCVADIEALPFANSHFALWWSSLSIQWCDSQAVFAEAARVLCSGGLLAVSTLGENTFSELRAAFKAVDSYRHTLDFATETQISTALQSAALTDVRISRKSITLYYPDLKTLLHAIKAIGANTVGAGGRRALLGRKGWHALEAAYETLRTPQGLPLSYDVILAYARSAKNTYSHATTA